MNKHPDCAAKAQLADLGTNPGGMDTGAHPQACNETKHDQPTGPEPDPADITRDRFLGGMVEACQPRARRHRSGLDAVLLAASLPQDAGGPLFDLGAGVGVAGLCAAARLPGVEVTLVERDTLAAKLARDNLALAANASFAARIRVVEADVIAPGRARAAQGLASDTANHIIINPPFYATEQHRASPHAARAGAHMLSEDGLEPWLRTASDLLVANGSLTMIFRADGLEEMLAAMRDRFGGIVVFPLFPRPGMNATRILVRGIRGSRAPMILRPGLVLHDNEGHGFSTTAEDILRHGAGLDLES